MQLLALHGVDGLDVVCSVAKVLTVFLCEVVNVVNLAGDHQ
jgi:hypothetical protein